MFPGKMNPRKINQMMKMLGVKTEEVEAKKVIIEQENGKIVIEEPQITLMTVQGQKTYTVVGKEKKEETASEEDIGIVMQKTGCKKKEAEKALKESNGDIAEAILKLEK